MNKLTMALAAAGLTTIMTGAYANDPTSSTKRSDQAGAQGTQQQAESSDGTTQANEPGSGVRHGSNEGGSDRTPTAERPTASPGTGDASDTNKNGNRPDTGASRDRGQGDAGNATNTAPDTGSGNSSRPR